MKDEFIKLFEIKLLKISLNDEYFIFYCVLLWAVHLNTQYVSNRWFILRYSLPNLTRQYIEAYYRANNGRVADAFADLELIQKNYGDISNVLFTKEFLLLHSQSEVMSDIISG